VAANHHLRRREGPCLSGFSTTPVADGVPVLSFVNVDKAWLSAAVAPTGAKALLSVQGENPNNILVTGCDLREAANTAEIAPGVPAKTLHEEFNIHTPR
jgi:hypothetical protein